VSKPIPDQLTRRLDRLERENRRLKFVGALALLGLGALTVMGQTAPTSVANTLEAERFVLRDNAGNVRATLGLRPDGTAALALADDTQQDRAVLSVTAPGQASVDLSDRAGHLRAGLGVRADGSALRAETRLEITLGERPDDAVRLTLFAPGASAVEISGDFTDWQPVELRRSTTNRDAWQGTFRIARGIHRINVRRDGGAWMAPAGTIRSADDFDGEVGVFLLP